MSGGNNKDVQEKAVLAKERFLLFVSKKAQRMATALYLVTDLLPDQEPLKWSLRHRCIELLSDLLPHARSSASVPDTRVVTARVSEITALLEVARSAHILSEMNIKLLTGACSELKTLFGELDGLSDLNHYVLDVPQQEQHQKDFKTTQNHQNDTVSVSDRMSHSKTTHKEIVHSRKERQKQIIELLEKQGSATMADIKEAVQGVSDKTLQRDVVGLVEDGVIERHGSKRWTNYSLL